LLKLIFCSDGDDTEKSPSMKALCVVASLLVTEHHCLRKDHAEVRAESQWGLDTDAQIERFCEDDVCESPNLYPGLAFETISSVGRAEKVLMSVPEMQANGSIFGGTQAGYFLLNGGAKDKSPDEVNIRFGMSTSKNQWLRPILDKLIGQDAEGKFWSIAQIRRSLKAYLSEQMTFDIHNALLPWSTQLLHHIHLGMEMSYGDALDFIEFQKGVLQAKESVKQAAETNYDLLRRRRGMWMNKYEELIVNDQRGVYPTNMTEDDVSFLAKSMMESLLFTGGQSLWSIISVGISLLHDARSTYSLEGGALMEQVHDDSQVEQFVYEVLRLFPVVGKFPYWTSDLKRLGVVQLDQILQHRSLWGDWAGHSFKLRDLDTYRKHARWAWAEPANGASAWQVQQPGRTGGLTPNSRGCPAQALSLAMATEFFKAWLEHSRDIVVTEFDTGSRDKLAPLVQATRPYVPSKAHMLFSKRLYDGSVTQVSCAMGRRVSFMCRRKEKYAVLAFGSEWQHDTRLARLLLYDADGASHDSSFYSLKFFEESKRKGKMNAYTVGYYTMLLPGTVASMNKSDCFEVTGVGGWRTRRLTLCLKDGVAEIENWREAFHRSSDHIEKESKRAHAEDFQHEVRHEVTPVGHDGDSIAPISAHEAAPVLDHQQIKHQLLALSALPPADDQAPAPPSAPVATSQPVQKLAQSLKKRKLPPRPPHPPPGQPPLPPYAPPHATTATASSSRASSSRKPNAHATTEAARIIEKLRQHASMPTAFPTQNPTPHPTYAPTLAPTTSASTTTTTALAAPLTTTTMAEIEVEELPW